MTIVRPARPDDAPSVAAIFDDTVGTNANCCGGPVALAEWTAAFARRGPQHWFAVAERGGTVTGWAQMKPWTTRPQLSTVAELVLYLHRDHRRTMAAADLLYAALGAARARPDLEHLVAVVVGSNDRSRRGLQAAGFVPTVHLDGIIDVAGSPDAIDWLVLDLRAPRSRHDLRWRARRRHQGLEPDPDRPLEPATGPTA